ELHRLSGWLRARRRARPALTRGDVHRRRSALGRRGGAYVRDDPEGAGIGRLGAEGRDRLFERAQIPIDDLRDLLHVDAEVLVREQIAEAGNLSPRDLGPFRLRLLGESFDRLPDDDEVVEDRVTPQALI